MELPIDRDASAVLLCVQADDTLVASTPKGLCETATRSNVPSESGRRGGSRRRNLAAPVRCDT